MGIRAYARHRRVRLSTVQAAIKAGRIRAPGGKIDRDAADASWADNTDQSKQNRRPDGARQAAPEAAPGGPGSFAKARAVRETYQAKLTHLKYQTQSGEVVAVAKVKDEWFKIARTTRDALMGAPDRLSAVIAAIPDGPDRDAKINAIMRKEIRSILMEICNAAKRNGLEGPDIEKE